MSEQQQLVCYREFEPWGADNLPQALLEGNQVDESTWVCVKVEAGRLKFIELNEGGEEEASYELGAEHGERVVYPHQCYRIEPLSDDMRVQLSFYCQAADFFHLKYGMSATHSVVRAAEEIVPAGKTLDMGCGQGRNALYLALKGFDVTAVDTNPAALHNVENLAQRENLNIKTREYDLNTAALGERFDYIVATVVMMFLQPQRVPQVIADMQANTEAGGYNLIVSAMDTEDFPCPMPFPFKFRESELREYYQGWDLVEYKEELGAMHATDEFGNPIQFKFVTMLAKKPQP